MSNEDAQLLTVKLVCAKLRLHRLQVLKLLNENAFPGAFKTSDARNGRWRIPPSAIDAFIQSRQKQTKTT